jgi:hypothetical protein
MRGGSRNSSALSASPATKKPAGTGTATGTGKLLLLETFSVLDFAPDELPKLPVAFAYYQPNKESRRVALQEQKKFDIQLRSTGGSSGTAGKLQLTIHKDIDDAWSETRPATQLDIDTTPGHILVEEAGSPNKSKSKNGKQAASSTKRGSAKTREDEDEDEDADQKGVEVPSSRTKKRRAASTGSSTPTPNKKAKGTNTKATTKVASSSKKKATPPSSKKNKAATPASKKKSAASSSPNKKSTTPAKGAGAGPKEVATVPAPEPEFADNKYGKGWIRKEFLRASGATKGTTDKYWYSPKMQHRLRSMAEVRRFLKCLEAKEGDEEEAFKLFKKGGGR